VSARINDGVSDVLIIGGGIMGASSALFLRQRGCSVSLLESGLVGQQASGVNFGNVRRQGRPLVQLPLANRASEIWRRVRELTGEDVEYLQLGHMRICYRDRPEALGKFEDYARNARDCGLDLEILSSASLHTRFPFLGREVLAASYSPQDGHANPRLAAPAFARAARRAGADVFEHTHIVGVEKQGEDFRVRSEDGRVFRAPVLLTPGQITCPRNLTNRCH
jgi:sarcosine oxidase subunit beta